MKITGKGIIFKNQYGYQISDNQKQTDGSYNKFYIPIYFPKSMEELPSNREYVEIEGFTKPYKTKEDKLGISYMITSWKSLESNPKKEEDSVIVEENTEVTEDPYEDFGNEVKLTDDDLPF